LLEAGIEPPADSVRICGSHWSLRICGSRESLAILRTFRGRRARIACRAGGTRTAGGAGDASASRPVAAHGTSCGGASLAQVGTWIPCHGGVQGACCDARDCRRLCTVGGARAASLGHTAPHSSIGDIGGASSACRDAIGRRRLSVVRRACLRGRVDASAVVMEHPRERV